MVNIRGGSYNKYDTITNRRVAIIVVGYLLYSHAACLQYYSAIIQVEGDVGRRDLLQSAE